MKVCPNCGHSSEKDNFCPYCGNPMMEQFSFEKEKDVNSQYQPSESIKNTSDEFDTFFEEKTTVSKEDELEEIFEYSSVSSEEAGYRVCPKCGTKYNSLLSGCPECSRPDPDSAKRNTDKYASDAKTLGIASVILAVIFPYLGFLLGLAGLKKYKKYPQSKKFFIIAITVSVCWFVVSIFQFAILA